MAFAWTLLTGAGTCWELLGSTYINGDDGVAGAPATAAGAIGAAGVSVKAAQNAMNLAAVSESGTKKPWLRMVESVKTCPVQRLKSATGAVANIRKQRRESLTYSQPTKC